MLNAHFTGISAESAWLHAWGGHTTLGKKIVEAVACRRRSEGSKAQLGALNFRSGHPWCGMRQDTNRASIERFMHELAGGVRSPGHVYFTGGIFPRAGK